MYTLAYALCISKVTLSLLRYTFMNVVFVFICKYNICLSCISYDLAYVLYIIDMTNAKLESQHDGINPFIDSEVEKVSACCLELVDVALMSHLSGPGSTCGSTWKFESGSENCACVVCESYNVRMCVHEGVCACGVCVCERVWVSKCAYVCLLSIHNRTNT